MTRLTVSLLFVKNMKFEPPAILQCDTSGEFFPFFFNDWRDAVHYLFWCRKNEKNCREMEIYNEWSDLYGYNEEEKFTGDLNEFKKIDDFDELIFTSIGNIKSSSNLKNKSAWKKFKIL